MIPWLEIGHIVLRSLYSCGCINFCCKLLVSLLRRVWREVDEGTLHIKDRPVAPPSLLKVSTLIHFPAVFLSISLRLTARKSIICSTCASLASFNCCPQLSCQEIHAPVEQGAQILRGSEHLGQQNRWFPQPLKLIHDRKCQDDRG